MLNSIITNNGAMVALQNLNSTNMELIKTQNRINTGLRVASVKDNGATWAIAQDQRSEVNSLNAVKDSINRAVSAVDVGIATGESVSDMLIQLKEKALSSSDSSIDTTSRAALNEDFKAIRDSITKTLANAAFNGVNLTNGTTASLTPLANADGTNVLTVSGQDMSLGGAIITLGTADTIATSASATSLVAVLDTSIANLSGALAKLGTNSKTLNNHLKFIDKLQDSINTGIGNLVDADMAKESAKLQAMQTKQQLGVQALGIANQAPQSILSLFRG